MATDPRASAVAKFDAALRANDRKALGIPARVSEIKAATNRLRAALRRTDLPPSLCRQLPKMLDHFARHRLWGDHVVYPGMQRMAAWGECSERQARSNFRCLVNGNVVVVVGGETGGRRRATEWFIDFMALRAWLVNVRANPHRTLLDQLRRVLVGSENPEVAGRENPEVLPPQNPEENPEATSARSNLPRRTAGTASVATRKRIGGRK